jgi:hypothetical protein
MPPNAVSGRVPWSQLCRDACWRNHTSADGSGWPESDASLRNAVHRRNRRWVRNGRASDWRACHGRKLESRTASGLHEPVRSDGKSRDGTNRVSCGPCGAPLFDTLELMMETPALRIFDLENEELSAIAFVRDYVELHFDGKILRALTSPSVVIGGGQFTFPGLGSRDALCSLIGRKLLKLTVDASHARLAFEGGAVVRISLDASHHVGGEAMHFLFEPGGPLEVW